MFFKRVKKVIDKFRTRHDKVILNNKELLWANVYHDSIRGKSWLRNVGISPSKWAANYSFLYVLFRVLSDYKPKKIIEFGIGESSKIISSFVANELPDSTHLIIEHDINWIDSFKLRFQLSENSKTLHLPIEIKTVNGAAVKSYKDIQNKVTGTFDLYVIDGPNGSKNFSRYDICLLTERLTTEDEFIIVIDDHHRQGEKQTAVELKNQLTQKGIKIHVGICTGLKSQIILTTEKYRFATFI